MYSTMINKLDESITELTYMDIFYIVAILTIPTGNFLSTFVKILKIGDK